MQSMLICANFATAQSLRMRHWNWCGAGGQWPSPVLWWKERLFGGRGSCRTQVDSPKMCSESITSSWLPCTKCLRSLFIAACLHTDAFHLCSLMTAVEEQREPEPMPNAKAAVLGFRIRHWPWQERTPVEILWGTPRSSWDGEDPDRHTVRRSLVTLWGTNIILTDWVRVR
jgi:hypothetical protein